MLSNNLIIKTKTNILISKNSFKLINEYNKLCKYNNAFIIAYSTYFKDEYNKDRLVYSARLGNSKFITLYDKESTRICEIKDNKIINDKELIRHNNMSHNLTLFNTENNIIGYGGVYSNSKDSKNNKGIFSLKYDNDKISNIKLTISKGMTAKCNYNTAFDSNISILKYNNKFYLYTRYNQCAGIRKTQLLISDTFDSNFRFKNIIKINDPSVLTYMQHIFIENNIFIGIFRIYRKKTMASHHIYNPDTKITYAITHSFDGINFILDNEEFIPNYSIYDFMSTNYKKNGNKKNFFSTSTNPYSTNNTIKEYEIRDGGYIYIEPAINSNESEIDLQIINNKNTILLNYTIHNEGYIHIAFLDEDQKTISKKQLLIKDHTNNRLDLPTNCKFINIKFKKSKIYQIL